MLTGQLGYDVTTSAKYWSQTQSQSGGESSRFVVSFEGKSLRGPLNRGLAVQP